jgi:hypothetical protein
MKDNKIVLMIASILIVVGLTQFDISTILPAPSRGVDVMELTPPTDENVKKEAQEVVDLLKQSGGNKNDFKKLRDLSLDLARLIELDGEDTVIKTTENIRQANSISGVMLRLDMKDKYKDLAKESKDVVVAAIGDDDVALTDDLRNKAVDSFNGLAWAYNEASK